MAERIKAPETRNYAIGLADASCEIPPEMQKVMDKNSSALEQMRATKRSIYSGSPSPHEG